MLTDEKNIVIIGNGCAGAECLRALRESGYGGEIHFFTNSKWPTYNPMLTTYYVAGKISFDQFFIYGKDSFYKKYRAHLHSGSPVVALDPEEKTVSNEDGVELKYNQCLVASGAAPFLPPIEGIASDRVYTMRKIDDAVRLKETLQEKPKKAIVIGASMIGIKMVELFNQLGIEVCLADLADHIFPLAAHPKCAKLIESRLIEKGVKLRFGSTLEKIEDTNRGLKAYFKDSHEDEEADLLIICIGVRANTGFIDKKQVEIKQGILVDGHMRTNRPGLYAAGDVAQGKDLLSAEQRIIGLWANARYQGRIAGKNMAGLKEIYPGNIPHNITHFMGMNFVSIGDIGNYDRIEEKADDKIFMQLFWREEFLIGANLLDTYLESGVIKNILLSRLINHNHLYNHPLPSIQNMLIKKVLAEVK